jgi:hypothetical protein
VSNNAVIVDDYLGVDMNFTAISGNISVTFDYTNNAQGGRTPNTDANIIIQALGTDLAMPLLVAATIERENSKTITVSTPLERNYSNV